MPSQKLGTGVHGPPSPSRNRILSRLPKELMLRWSPQLQRVMLAPPQILESRGPLQHVIFPLSCMVSLQSTVRDGRATQIALVGRNGMLGISALAGAQPPLLRHVVVVRGEALRLPMAVLRADHAVERNQVLRTVVSHYLQSLLMQAAQAAICNRHHAPQEQLATLLLLAADLRRADALEITHERIAGILGMRRETVSQAASRLQNQGLLRYRRGQIFILDRPALIHVACECYENVSAESNRPLGWPAGPPGRDAAG